MPHQLRITPCVIISLFAPFVALGIFELAAANSTSAAADKDAKGYIRSVNTNAELTEALENLGVKSIAFALRCPPGHQASVSLVGTDRTGKIVKESSFQTVGFHDDGDQREWTVRLTKTDPRAFIENYTGKIKWRLMYQSEQRNGARESGSNVFWHPDWYHVLEGAAGNGFGGGQIDDPPV